MPILLLRFWKPLAALIALAAMLIYAHHSGAISERHKWQAKVSEARQERIDDYEKRIKDAKVAQAAAEADTAALSAKLDDAQARTETLQKALARASLVTHAPSPVPGCPPVPRLGRDFRLLFNAAIDGTAPVPANP